MKKILLLVTILAFLNINGAAQSNPTDAIKDAKPIVMVGDSITYQGDWQKVLNRQDVTNWGIPGYTTEQISWTLKHVIELRPKVCFLEGGINDITLGITPERVFQNQVKVINTLLAAGITPVVQSTIYQNPSGDRNKRVKKINKLISGYCLKHKIAYLDLNRVLSSGDELKKELTTDGTHLLPAAYSLWAVLVADELKKLSL